MKGFNIVELNNGKKEIDIFNFVYNSEVVKNLIQERCQVLRGELPYNASLGIELKTSKTNLDLDISNIILNTNGVKRIISLESVVVNKKYNAKIKIETNYNEMLEVNI